MTDEQRDGIRVDIIRRNELYADYRSLDDIALQVGLARTTVRNWAKEFGIAEDKRRDVQVKIKPSEPALTPVVNFLTMPTVVSQPAQGWYY
jgi:hypothetical protein